MKALLLPYHVAYVEVGLGFGGCTRAGRLPGGLMGEEKGHQQQRRHAEATAKVYLF